MDMITQLRAVRNRYDEISNQLQEPGVISTTSDVDVFRFDDAGEIVELRCTYDPATKGGNAPDGRKVKATMHWLSAQDSIPAEIRIYNQLFSKPNPDAGNFAADLNPDSLEC